MANERERLIERARPWPLYGYAPGSYMCLCRHCGDSFNGDKRAIDCLECAILSAKAALSQSPPSGEEVERVPTHRCKVCGALWIKWPDGSWSLASAECGACCDNVPMGDQIEPLPLADDDTCTSCGGFGIDYQTERRCACQPALSPSPSESTEPRCPVCKGPTGCSGPDGGGVCSFECGAALSTDKGDAVEPMLDARELLAAPSPIASEDEVERDWANRAAEYTLDAADNPLTVRDADGRSVEHASWMLLEIVNGNIAGRKAHRWLGYAQGLLVVAGRLTLEEAKQANKRASDEASAALSSRSRPDEGGE